MYKKTTLKNGLRVISVRDKDSRAVTVLVLVATGSKYENKENNGISHLLEHLLFKGTKKRKTPIAVIEPLDRVGGVYNAFTSEECTGYWAKVESTKLDLALDTISDIYLNSVLDKNEVEKEKGVVIEEINMYNDHPASYVNVLWNKVLYGDQPAGWDIAGTKSIVSSLKRDELHNYMKSQYVASNTVVCIAGNIPSDKALIEKINKYFSKIITGDAFPKPEVIEKQDKPECLLLKKDTDQTHFCLGGRAYNVFDRRKYAQEVLAAILGGMMSSRLFVKIREELSLAYYVRTSEVSDTDTGCVVTQVGVDNNKVDKAISAIIEEYKKIAENGVPAKELQKAKDNIKGKTALALETSDALASFYGTQELLQKKILSPADIYKEIDKVSQRDIKAIAKDIFRPENINLAIIGPFDDKERFQKLLN